MIGNDIVDFQLAAEENNYGRKGFLEKVFNKEEQSYIANSTAPFKMVWLLWSMKESAYKAYLQEYATRFFSPIKLECKLLKNNKGSVLIQKEMFFTKSKLTKDFVYTVASDKKTNLKIASDCFQVDGKSYESQHKETQKKILKALAKKISQPVENLKIKKNEAGVPQLFQDKILLKNTFSISHHGNFGAVCIAQ